MDTLKNIKKLFKLKSYVYGHISFLKTLKAYDPKKCIYSIFIGNFNFII